MTKNVVTQWSKEIERAARRAELEWPGIVEAEDLAQAMYVHILERPGTVRDLSQMDANSRYRTIHKIAQRIASKERDALDLYSGDFRYSIGEVERLLRAVARYWNREADSPFSVSELSASWSAGDVISTGRGVHSDPTADVALEHLQSESVRKDFLEALERLNEGYLDVIIRRFINGESITTEGGDAMRLSRALRELTIEMNRARKRQHAGKFEPGKSLGDGPGTRRAISNETARAISQSNWDADYDPAPTYHRDNNSEKEVWDL